MAHHIYHTEALVLRSVSKGEANKMLVIYTKELGLIFAAAQGVRHLHSKLRFALSDYSYVRLDLVRGRDIWRVTSATPVENFISLVRTPRSALFLMHISKLLERLLPDEDPSPVVFEDVLTAFRYLQVTDLSPENIETTELTLVLRTLKHLGYVGIDEQYASHVEGSFNPDDVTLTPLVKKTIIFEINRALRESQL